MLEKQIIINSLNITYFQSDNLKNDGVVVFLHGWGSRAVHLKSIFENLPNFVALDLPGFGGSDLPLMPWGAADLRIFWLISFPSWKLKIPFLLAILSEEAL